MAFFKFRRDERAAQDGGRGGSVRPDGVEAIRRHARHRLIGAVVLVGLGVVLFPLVFDTQPRSQAIDIPIEIADRDKVPPLAAPAASRASADAAVTAPAAATASAQRALRNSTQNAASEAVLEEKQPIAQENTASFATKTVAEMPRSQASASASASAAANATTGRFVVQFGAFSEAAKAREARVRVEKAGLKTYTTIAETEGGKRIRVRAGPFVQRAEADRAAERIKALGLTASVLTL